MQINKPRALIIAYNGLGRSGVPNVIYQTIKCLNSFYSFDILVFSDDIYYFNLLKNEGIEDIRIIVDSFKKPKNKLSKALYHLFSKPIHDYKVAKKLFRENNYFLVHSFKEYDSWPFLKAAKKHNIKKRIFHCNVIHEKTSNIVIKRGKKLSLRYANVFVGVSNLCAEKAFSNKQYSIIYNTYDQSRFNLDVPCKLNKKDLILTQVASFSKNKNQLFSIDVIYELTKLYSQCKLLFVGLENEENYLSLMKERIEKLGIKKNVEFRSYDSDFLSYTSFFIIPSKIEGASLVAIEAQACGISVFASSSLTQEIDAGGVSFIDLKEGAKNWANKIYRYFLDFNNSRKKIELKQFSEETFATKMINLYSDSNLN